MPGGWWLASWLAGIDDRASINEPASMSQHQQAGTDEPALMSRYQQAGIDGLASTGGHGRAGIDELASYQRGGIDKLVACACVYTHAQKASFWSSTMLRGTALKLEAQAGGQWACVRKSAIQFVCVFVWLVGWSVHGLTKDGTYATRML